MDKKDILRFWKKVQKTETCWNWIAGSRGNGYGCLKYKRKTIDAHRFSWMIHFGTIPSDKVICHQCDNRSCINPNHLFLGSYKENMEDAVRKHRLPEPKHKKYFSKEARHTADKKLWLDYWHRKGKYLREIRKNKIVESPSGKAASC